MIAKCCVVPRTKVREFMVLPMPPQELYWVQLGRIGREPLDRNPTRLLLEVFPHQVTAMTWQTVPDDHHLASQVARKVLEEVDHLWPPHRPRVEPEVEIPEGDACDGRERFPIEVILENRRVAPRCPGSHPIRPFAEPALVDKDYGFALARRVFFSNGQRSSFQRWMAFSSRSSARPLGRCAVHPICLRMRQT